MIKLSLSIQELARVVAPPGSFKMPCTHSSVPLPCQPKVVKVQPALEPPQFLTGEVMVWESSSRKFPKASIFSR
ncbi:hypothetical protein DSO57_1030027 [Entomophthora muscae]|uniref:Uncharacterized protein n=1 Tax=Entomophthora muscae TaxID=34485 RepID=A0ACC2TZG9_9FUNG|nr:hypothetical protein DSO57_1030027 [Entomophthora muscae]